MTLVGLFAFLAVMAIGGPGGALSAAQREVVGRSGWLPGAEFSGIFGLCAAMPGPNIIFFLALGYRLDGWSGLAVAVACYAAPLAAAAYVVGRAGGAEGRAWVALGRRGLHATVLGLGAFGAIVAAEPLPRPFLAITAAAVALLVTTRINPSIVVLGAALVGAAVL